MPNKTTVTPAAIQAAQGTRLSSKAPWETYSEEMSYDPDIAKSPTLAAEIDEYTSRGYHEKSSQQNQEELAMWKEGNDAVANEYKWCTKEEYEDIKARFGRIIHSSELINLLRDKCHLKCWYREHPHADKITLLVQKHEGMVEPEVGCWVQNGFAPEFTVMGFDEHGVPLAERYRGWRTVLLQLILKGMLTEEIAHKVFGSAERCCAERYNSMLYFWRNRPRLDVNLAGN